MSGSQLFYFAYGSNMSTLRLMARVPSARLERAAVLFGYRLVFNKRGADDSAKCNIEAAEEKESVHGVVWRMNAADKPALDAAEGPNYYTWWYQLAMGDRNLPVFTYVARPGAIAKGLRPYDWYLAFLVAGAREHGLPPDYLETLSRVATRPDPDAGRASLNRRLLSAAES